MNAKTCKKLRFVARQETIGLPERKYTKTPGGQIVPVPDCTRAAYRRLKELVERAA